MADYYNVTTNTGDAEIAAAIASNTKLAITHIAFGDGNGSVPTPNKTRTSLIREVHRQAVTKYERHPTNANWIVIETIIPSNVGGFTIREMGVIANGKLISHGSHAPFEKVTDPTGVSEYRIKFTQNIKDGNVVNITLDESLIYASQAWVNENYIPRADIVNNLTTADATKPLSAAQGKVLQDNKLGKTENAVSATKLQTSRTIGGVAFDGTTNIDLPGVNTAGNQNTSGNAATATKLQTSRTIGGVAFDGTTNIDLPGVNIAGNQNTSGNAATATKLNTARKINGVNFDGTADILVPDNWEYIPYGADLNNYTTAGHYFCDQDTVGASVWNSPIAYSFTLSVDQTAGVVQRIVGYLGANAIEYKRTYYSGTWSQWDKVYSSRHLPSKIDLVSTSETNDNSFILKYTDGDKSSFFYDNAAGKHFDAYTSGFFASKKTGSYFGLGASPITKKIKAMTGVVRENGTIDLASSLTLLDNNSTNIMSSISVLSWQADTNEHWSTGIEFKASPNSLAKSSISAFGPPNDVSQLQFVLDSTAPWEKGNGKGIWIDRNEIYSNQKFNMYNGLDVHGDASIANNYVTGSVFCKKYKSDDRFWFTNNNESIGQGINVGNLFVGSGFSNAANTPNQGILSTGMISTQTGFDGVSLSIDNRTLKPFEVSKSGSRPYFVTEGGLINGGVWGSYGDFLSLNTYGDASAGYQNGLFFAKDVKRIVHYQASIDASVWGIGKVLAYVDDNVASATKLQTARTISIGGAVQGSAFFDGSSDISINTSSNHGVIRAYANFNGVSNYFRKNVGIASIENQGSGRYLVTLSNAAPDANYIVQATCSHARNDAGSVILDPTFVQTVNQFRLRCNFGGDNTVGSFAPEFLNILITY